MKKTLILFSACGLLLCAIHTKAETKVTPTSQSTAQTNKTTNCTQSESKTTKPTETNVCNYSTEAGWSEGTDFLKLFSTNKKGKDAAFLAKFSKSALSHDKQYLIGKITLNYKKGKSELSAPNNVACYTYSIKMETNYKGIDDESASICTILMNENGQITNVDCEASAG